MTTLRDDTIAPNCGWAARMAGGYTLRISAAGGVSLVCFNAADLTERFDQARTKVYNMRLWITAGEQLFSKLNNPMMAMVADGFAGIGRHDLQYGMCSGPLLARAAAEGVPARYAHMKGRPAPVHGCHESLAAALQPWGIPPERIPMPLNLFQHTEIDTASGTIRPRPVRPTTPATVDLRAMMDLVVAVATCPDLEAPSGGGTARACILVAP